MKRQMGNYRFILIYPRSGFHNYSSFIIHHSPSFFNFHAFVVGIFPGRTHEKGIENST